MESIFSAAKCVMPDNGRRITPHIFEATLFFRSNERIWDAELLGKAIIGDIIEEVNGRLREHDAYLVEYESK